MTVAALALVGCQQEKDYKALGEQMAQRMEQLCEQQDADAIKAYDDSIRMEVEAVKATGDTLAIKAFGDAVRDARERGMARVTELKILRGEAPDSVVHEVMNDVMEGNVSIDALTSSIDAALKIKTEEKK